MAALRREVVLEINSAEESEKFDNLPELPAQTMRQRSKDLSDQESHCPSPVLRQGSNTSRSWSLNLQSRLLDPLEEESVQGLKSPLNHEADQDQHNATKDMPKEYIQQNFSTCHCKVLLWMTITFIIIMGLICSVFIPVLKRYLIWDLPLWKWWLMILVLVGGYLVSNLAVRIVVKIMECNCLMRERVLYFVYGLRTSVRFCLWLAIVFVGWRFILIDKGVHKKTRRSKILSHVTTILICFLVAAVLWLLKTLALKIFALFFHVHNYFEKLKEALFSQYVIETLYRKPAREVDPNAAPKVDGDTAASAGSGRAETTKCCWRSSTIEYSNREDQEILVDELNMLSGKNISGWNMKRMINRIRHGLTLEEKIKQSHIRTESQAKEAAENIFQKVAKRGSDHIEMDDVKHFMNPEEAHMAMKLFGAREPTQNINLFFFREWMVNAFYKRKHLVLSLNDADTAVEDLHKLLDIFVILTIFVIWVNILGTTILHFIILMGSQLLLLTFVFGSTCKETFESIVFLFVMHPFDVGDCCEVDGVLMVVEGMKILTTTFLRHDYQKMIYPNSLLAKKAIGNLNRSLDISEDVDFFIPISTSPEKIASMEEQITRYVESKSEQWHPASRVMMIQLEDLHTVKMRVFLTHKMNRQDMDERWIRRAQLVKEIFRIFNELNIEHPTMSAAGKLLEVSPTSNNFYRHAPPGRLPRNESTSLAT